jgi:hypothetical protein
VLCLREKKNKKKELFFLLMFLIFFLACSKLNSLLCWVGTLNLPDAFV